MKPEIKLRGKGFNFVVPLGDGAVTPTAGGPNIEELARADRPALTRGNGQILKRLDVPAFWDGWKENESVEADMMDVVNLSLELPLADFTAEGPMPFSGGRFLMDWPEWGKLNRRKGPLLQAELTLKLVEFNDPSDLHPHRKGINGASSHNGGVFAPASITLKQPENLVEVAARYMGDSSQAKAIGKLNGIHDIKKKLPAGTRLQLPGG